MGGIEIRVVMAGRLEGHGHMGLFQPPGLAPLTWAKAARSTGIEARRKAAEKPLRRAQHRLGIDRARGAVISCRPVALRDETGEVVPAEALHPLGRAEDGAAEGLVEIGDLLQPVEDHVVGRVEAPGRSPGG